MNFKGVFFTPINLFAIGPMTNTHSIKYTREGRMW